MSHTISKTIIKSLMIGNKHFTIVSFKIFQVSHFLKSVKSKIKDGVIMNDTKFEEAIKKVKKNGIVLNITETNEPVILKHNKGEFKEISETELMKNFNDHYSGKNVYEISAVTKELMEVEISNYKK